ncbi:BspA family leucine-rich repeat surface protein [Reichenbachiella versicolor]|uniref:BspA family leucine-rich repeat surface protein n=1 Tax=Reichenbachiella versicolor TaxID=1821036 RepID=UPI000D6DE213|nr:BspA family leucine-rich repeat surface protein [Reichenbachiella versicolor]
MKNLKLLALSVILTVIGILACDENDAGRQNTAPEIADQSFSVLENASDQEVIGTVTATDAEEDKLSFSISENADDLFEITATGELSLAADKSLDFETNKSHTITVQVKDASETSEATITINVLDVDEITGEPNEPVEPNEPEAPLEPEEENKAPSMADQSFTVSEDIAEDVEIGNIIATDEQALTYTLVENSNDVFELSTDGRLSLASGMSLDYEAINSHEITVEVSDGELTAQAIITIKLIEVYDPFITRWETSTASEAITIPTKSNYTYDYTVDWGDGSDIESHTGDASHTYTEAGTYIVKITGEFPAIYFNNKGSILNIQDVISWGDTEWKTMVNAFWGCSNLEVTATDAPDLSDVSNLGAMFRDARSLNQNLSHWDVSSVTFMSRMFYQASSFNQPLNWNVSSVTNMFDMFYSATLFNQDLSEWETDNVLSCGGFSRGSALETSNLPTKGCFGFR